MHSEISGVTDYRMPNDDACLEKIRSIVAKLGHTSEGRASIGSRRNRPARSAEIYGLIPDDRTKPYNMHDVLASIVDDGEFDEYKAGYGKTIVNRLRPRRTDGPWAWSRTSARSRKRSSGKCTSGASSTARARTRARVSS